jgi:hypothetical protein
MSSVQISGSASGAGVLNIAAPTTATNRTLTLPDATTTFVGTDVTQTLTNKTLTSPTIATINSGTSTTLTLQSNGTNGVILDTSQNLKFNSGYGSVVTAYGCRAWANFSGVSSVTVRGSGGVTSIAYTAAGKYTVSLSTTLPDLNYSLVLGTSGLGSGTGGIILVEDTAASSALSRTSSTFVLIHSYSFVNPGAGEDNNAISNNFAVFR